MKITSTGFREGRSGARALVLEGCKFQIVRKFEKMSSKHFVVLKLSYDQGTIIRIPSTADYI